MKSIQIENRVVEYNLIFSDRKKTIGLTIDHSGKLTVRAPRRLSEDAVQSHVFHKKKWILKHLERMEANQEATPPKNFLSGEQFLLQGNSYKLEILKSEDEAAVSLVMKYGRFVATIPASLPESAYKEYLRPLFMDYYRQKAEQVINERLAFYMAYFDEVPNAVVFKDYKSKWGSCSRNNKLFFNWRIIMVETAIIDYLVVHELCHIVHKNHSKEYWEAVGNILPDYAERRKWLRLNGHRLSI